jgi:hypothetical protein
MLRIVTLAGAVVFLLGLSTASAPALADSRDRVMQRGAQSMCSCLKTKRIGTLGASAKESAMEACSIKAFVSIAGDLPGIGIDISDPGAAGKLGEEIGKKAIYICAAEVMAVADSGENKREELVKRFGSKLCTCMRQKAGTASKSELSKKCMMEVVIKEIGAIQEAGIDFTNTPQMEKFGQDVGLNAVQTCPQQILDL